MLMAEQPLFGTDAHSGVFDDVPIPVALIDSNAQAVLYMNDTFCTMLGRTRNELIGVSWETFTHPEDIERTNQALEPFLAGETDKLSHDKRYITKDGHVIWANLTIFRQHSSGPVGFHIVIANNITALKKKEALLHSRTVDLIQTREAIFSSMAILSEFRDRETGEHILRTRLYVKLLLENLPGERPFSNRAISLISSSAILHDIGKVGIPDTILLKPGKLTPDEFEVMKTHTTIGARAISRTQKSMNNDSFLLFAKEIAEAHHERWDGTGYPYGLSGTEIPLTARVMAIADVYDALRSDRPYKEASTHGMAVDTIMNEAGTHFDPTVTGVFWDLKDEFERIASTEKVHLERELEESPVVLFD